MRIIRDRKKSWIYYRFLFFSFFFLSLSLSLSISLALFQKTTEIIISSSIERNWHKEWTIQKNQSCPHCCTDEHDNRWTMWLHPYVSIESRSHAICATQIQFCFQHFHAFLLKYIEWMILSFAVFRHYFFFYQTTKILICDAYKMGRKVKEQRETMSATQ